MGLFRPVMAKINFDIREREMGGQIVKKRIEPIILPVPVSISNIGNKSLEQIKEELTDWLYYDEDKKLEFVYNPERYYMAQLYDIELEERHEYARGYIYFICQDPFRFGADNNLSLTSTFSNFTIKGKVKTEWTSTTTFSGAASTFTLENNQGGKLLLEYAFKAGDVLKVERKRRRVTLNGVVLTAIVLIQTNWVDLMLKPGTVQFRATQPTTLTYTERYR